MEKMRLTTWDSTTREKDTFLVEIENGTMADKKILARSSDICTSVDKLSGDAPEIMGIIKGVKCITLIRTYPHPYITTAPRQTMIDHFEEI